jgi:outer membrane lipoprotein SlyB
MRSSVKTLIIAPALVLAAACSKDKPADATLSNDLTLAAQAKQTATLDSISAAERTKAAAVAAAPVAAAPALRASTPVHHTSTVRHRTASSGSSSGSSGTYSAPAPRGTVTEKNTKRDAVVGAAAGAVIGGATHGVKGGIIGAAAGGILGGIIGNNVDVKKHPAP